MDHTLKNEDEQFLLALAFHPQFRLSWLAWYFDEHAEVERKVKMMTNSFDATKWKFGNYKQ